VRVQVARQGRHHQGAEPQRQQRDDPRLAPQAAGAGRDVAPAELRGIQVCRDR
jgi:hypothetical protein